MKYLTQYMIGAMFLLAPGAVGNTQKAQGDKSISQKKTAGNQKQWDKSVYQQKTAGDQKKTIKTFDQSQKGKNGGKAYSAEIMAQKAQWVKDLDQEKITDEMKEWLKDYDLSLKGKKNEQQEKGEESDKAALAEEEISDSDSQEAESKDGAYSLGAFSAIFKNNIFDPNRRPGRTAAKKIVKKAPPKVIFMELTGVLVFGDGGVAFFEGSGPRYSGPREKGEEIAGLTLKDVQIDHVILAKQDDETVLPVGSRFGTWGDGQWSVVLAPYRPLDRMPLTSLAAASSKKGRNTKAANAKKAQDWAAMSSGKKLAVYQSKADAYMNSEKGRGSIVQFQQLGDRMVKMVQEAGSRSWSYSVFDPDMTIEK